jgi:hypothetical protein
MDLKVMSDTERAVVDDSGNIVASITLSADTSEEQWAYVLSGHTFVSAEEHEVAMERAKEEPEPAVELSEEELAILQEAEAKAREAEKGLSEKERAILKDAREQESAAEEVAALQKICAKAWAYDPESKRFVTT